MPYKKARPLDDIQKVQAFFKDVLEYNPIKHNQTITKIVEAEILVSKFRDQNTLLNKNYRDCRYFEDDKRNALHKKIFHECITKEYEPDEKKAKRSGLIPKNGLKNEKQAYIVIGLPASGKSTIAEKIAQCTGSIFLDSDIVSRKFPEFNMVGGADLVHKEAGFLTFGSTDGSSGKCEYSIQQYCLVNDINIVVQKVGDNPLKLREYRNKLIKQGYKVHLILVSLDREDSTKRSIRRFIKTKRYVPISLIYDGYANNPMLTYFRVKFDNEWESVAELDNFVELGNKPKLIHHNGNCIFNNPTIRSCYD